MNSDFKDLLSCLNGHKVRYLIIGGYAVAFHAEPRFTKDLDIWIEASRTNSARIVTALREFGAPVASVSERDFSTPGTLFIFGVPPARVDIMNRIEGADFGAMYKRRIRVKIGKVQSDFISLPDLVTLKKLSNRPQDKLDVKALVLAASTLQEPRRANKARRSKGRAKK